MRHQLGTHHFHPGTAELRDAEGAVIALRKQSAAVLACLVQRPEQVVTKAELFAAVWPNAHVTDDSLVQCISEIRRALDDGDHKIIHTVPKTGYRVQATALSTPALPLPDRPSIAVLAFDDHSAGADAGFLSDAIAEGIIRALSRFPELFVIARNSSFAFRGQPTDVGDISRRLGVRYLLEGSQQKAGDRLRVGIRLIDATDGQHLLSDVYDRDLSDLFQVQDDIVRRVVASVAQKVIGAEGRRVTHADGAGLSALLHHLKARVHVVRFTPEENERARQANLAAIRADPDQPYGHVGLTYVHINGVRWGWSDLTGAEALTEARKAAQTALDLAPDYYDSHAAMAHVHLEENDLDSAIARAERALELNPNDTNAMCDLADFLGYAGRTADAEALLRAAMRLDPLHPDWIRWNLAWIQYLAGDCAGALRTMTAMAAIPPMAYRVLAVIHVCLGRQDAARRAIRQLTAFDPSYSLAEVRRYYQGKFRNAADLDRLLDDLRAAGLPD